MARYFGELVPSDNWAMTLQTYLKQNNLTGQSPVKQECNNMPVENDQFIIGTISPGVGLSVASDPHKHSTFGEADIEARRLARQYPTKEIVILQVRRVVKAVGFDVRDRI